jgi:hypothetical protein
MESESAVLPAHDFRGGYDHGEDAGCLVGLTDNDCLRLLGFLRGAGGQGRGKEECSEKVKPPPRLDWVAPKKPAFPPCATLLPRCTAFSKTKRETAPASRFRATRFENNHFHTNTILASKDISV